MDLYINDLKISDNTKNALHELSFTMVSELEGQDYISLIQKFPLKRHCVYSIIKELNATGYLLPPNNAVSIYYIPMSKKLGSSGIMVGKNPLKALILLGLRKIDFAKFLWVDMEPLADVVCQPCSRQCLKSGLAGRQPGYHIALSM